MSQQSYFSIQITTRLSLLRWLVVAIAREWSVPPLDWLAIQLQVGVSLQSVVVASDQQKKAFPAE